MHISALRKRSQRSFAIDDESCELCGSDINIQRHHPDPTSANFLIVCQKCHVEIHMKDGSWGRGLRKTKNCVICGSEFVPNHSKKHTTCSKPCLSELGKRNALKRWHPNESTDLKPSETQSCHKSQSGSEEG